MAARKNSVVRKAPPPKPMFHVSEVRYIKESSEKFLLRLSECGESDGNLQDWIEEASLLLDEHTLKTGRELGLPYYEEIMKIMIMFLDTHNDGKKIGVGVNRKEYDKWKSHQRALEEYDRSDFQRNNPILYRIANVTSMIKNLYNKITGNFTYS